MGGCLCRFLVADIRLSYGSQKRRSGVTSSLGGWGYDLREDALFVGVSSAGLPQFPYGAERNYGLGCGVLVKRGWAPKGIQLIQEEEELPQPGLILRR